MSQPILITKASGEQAPFSEEKLLRSLVRSGATPEVAQEVLTEVESQLYPGISTQQIYRIAFRVLKKRSRRTAAHYNLKQAIMELGPSGFPFEQYVGELFRAQGFHVKVGTLVKGHCVTHEIDVIAQNDHQHHMVECKYHNVRGIGCNVKVPLYVYSRFKDVETQWMKDPALATKQHHPWIATNTKFTGDAIAYGECMGMRLLGWNYPREDNLHVWIERFKLYPITALTTLNRHERQALLQQKTVLCRDLLGEHSPLHQMRLPASRLQAIRDEAARLPHGASPPFPK